MPTLTRKTNKKWGVYTWTPEQQLASWRKYSRSAKGIFNTFRSSCIRHKNDRLNITQEEFIKWYIIIEKVCHYCGITQEEWNNGTTKRNKRFHRLTIDRKDNNKPYEIGNIAISCFTCNMIKADIFTEEEMIIIGLVIKNKRKNI